MFACPSFSHINANRLVSLKSKSLFDTKPWQLLDLSILDTIDLDIDLTTRAIRAFDELQEQPIANFDILDVLSLVIVDNKLWQQADIAMRVAENWWHSALNVYESSQQVFYISLLFVIQYLKQPEFYRYRGSSHALQVLSKMLTEKDAYLWEDLLLEKLVRAVIFEDAQQVAQLALNNNIYITQLMKRYRLPIGRRFEKQARAAWLPMYLKLKEKRLGQLTQAITEYLTEQEGVYFAVERAESIFGNPYFSTDVMQLEQQTHKFADIYKWLRDWSHDIEFMQLLDYSFHYILRCWLGAGYYYELERGVRYIDKCSRNEKNPNRSLNRYIFWTNYQQHIVNYWLLIPLEQKDKYQHLFKEANVKVMVTGASTHNEDLSSVPIILLKFDEYYFIQPLVKSSFEVDLIMTRDIDTMEKALRENEMSSDVFYRIKPCLIHDYMFLWQRDMALCLEEFGIRMGNPYKFVCTPDLIYNFRSPKNFDHKKRLEAIEKWYRNSTRKYDDVKNIAMSYQQRHERHGSNR